MNTKVRSEFVGFLEPSRVASEFSTVVSVQSVFLCSTLYWSFFPANGHQESKWAMVRKYPCTTGLAIVYWIYSDANKNTFYSVNKLKDEFLKISSNFANVFQTLIRMIWSLTFKTTQNKSLINNEIRHVIIMCDLVGASFVILHTRKPMLHFPARFS